MDEYLRTNNIYDQSCLNIKRFFRQFAENELWPIAGKIDKSCEYPREQILKMGQLGRNNTSQIQI